MHFEAVGWESEDELKSETRSNASLFENDSSDSAEISGLIQSSDDVDDDNDDDDIGDDSIIHNEIATYSQSTRPSSSQLPCSQQCRGHSFQRVG